MINAAGVTATRIAGIDQHRFARGSHDQRRAAAFRIDPVNVERFVRRACPGRNRDADDDSERETGDAAVHHGSTDRPISTRNLTQRKNARNHPANPLCQNGHPLRSALIHYPLPGFIHLWRLVGLVADLAGGMCADGVFGVLSH
jgi:hypothetical protein